jgi:hypothetical protein
MGMQVQSKAVILPTLSLSALLAVLPARGQLLQPADRPELLSNLVYEEFH